MHKFQIAIDGPASSGKSTIAKIIARDLGYIYVDTGAMYRVVTFLAIKNGVAFGDAAALVALTRANKISFENVEGGQLTLINGVDVSDDIRQTDVTNNVSEVAALKAVREELVRLQREIAETHPVVMDGRDIGTVVLPDADVKIFMVASVTERAERRYKENISRGIPTDLAVLEKEIAERDYKDSHRAESPLKQADDAILVDTTGMSIDDVVNRIKELIK
ncbi:MAG: (d)CMP kinase [Lactobacillales bacterium]|jgi:cytidylate kinase|nr:(d)CMP kinase [Lactobacillales bacterium]